MSRILQQLPSRLRSKAAAPRDYWWWSVGAQWFGMTSAGGTWECKRAAFAFDLGVASSKAHVDDFMRAALPIAGPKFKAKASRLRSIAAAPLGGWDRQWGAW